MTSNLYTQIIQDNRRWLGWVATATSLLVGVLIGLWILGVVHPFGHPAPKVGTVVDRSFTPAHDEFVPGIYVPGSESCFPTSGGGESCSYNPGINIPAHEDHYSDSWRVKLTDGQHTGWRSVSQALYEQCQLNTSCDTR